MSPGLCVQPPRTPLIDGPWTRVLSLGSCFAEHFAAFFSQLGFPSYHRRETCNHFNPVSLADQLRDVLTNRALRPEDVQVSRHLDTEGVTVFTTPYRRGLFADSVDGVLASATALDAELRAELARAAFVVCTLGTADVLRARNGSRVLCAGNHVAPDAYRLSSLSVEEIAGALREIRSHLHALAGTPPTLLLTVSPQRYFWDAALIDDVEGSQLVANSLSKAKLRVAADVVCREFADVHYFPAYEIAIDELRWVEPLFDGHGHTHVGSLTPTVVLDRFVETYGTDLLRRYIVVWEQLEKLAAHFDRTPHLRAALAARLQRLEVDIAAAITDDRARALLLDRVALLRTRGETPKPLPQLPQAS